MAGKNVLWPRSIPSTKADIRRSRLPIQKKIIASVRLFTQPGPGTTVCTAKNSEPFRRRNAVKYVTDLPIGA
jgi:hypothetical protein